MKKFYSSQTLVIDAQKLSRGLKDTFDGLKDTFGGIATIFDSLGVDFEEKVILSELTATAKAFVPPDASADLVGSESSEVSASSIYASAGTAKETTSDVNTQTTAEVSGGKKLNEAEQSENSGINQAAGITETSDQPAQVTEVAEVAQAAQAAQVEGTEETSEAKEAEEANSSITYDDLTKIIVEKIKQDTANNKKIEAIVNNYGVSMVSQLPKSKYEAFMAELASL